MGKYVENTWYPLTWSRDVKHELRSHTIIEKKVVLYRTSEGHFVAMEDMCPHRVLRLFRLRIRDDAVEGRYHGGTISCSST